MITMIKLSLLLLLLSHSARCMLLGWVESPGYPNGYQPHASMNWSRCAPEGYTLSIRLLHLDLEDSQDCENDAVKIFSNRNLISVLCGQRDYEELQSVVNPSLVSFPGGCLSLSFHSDYSNIKRHGGFRGFYTVQDFDECEDDPENGCSQFCHNTIGGYRCSCRHGYHLGTDKHTCTVSCGKDLSGLNHGVISSPSWPGSYGENADCRYTLSVEADLQLELHFLGVFDVEQSPDGQCIDALTIETPSGTMGPFCGHTPPQSPFLTHSHSVVIRFTSDGFGTNKGFNLHFKTRGKVCPAVVTSHSTVTPQRPENHPGQTVKVTCDLGHIANTQGILALSSQYETTCQRNGIWVPSYPCEPVNCGRPDIPEDGILQLVGSENSHTWYKDQIQLTCSSKYYTLEGDDTYTCSAGGKWVSGGGTSQMPKCTPVCGTHEKAPVNAGRILGGRNANLGEIPWQLLIKEPSRGAATLINDRWAVTAAHVVENLEETSLRLYGGLIDGRTANQRPGVAVMESERIIIHPGYSRGVSSLTRTSYDNDIALIRLASRVNFDPNLLPICLPEGKRGLVENEQGTVSGWGMTEGRSSSLVTSRMLKYAEIGVYSLSNCQITPRTSNGSPMIFTDNMFCAGAEGTDSCQKDSGGPFVIPAMSSGTGPYRLVGIVSWGPPCEERKFKGYYTKVENYVDWIKETIDKVENSLFNPEMGLTFCIVWFLFALVCECWTLPDSGPLMHGEVQSPGYPQPYPPNLQEQWDLSVPEGYRIRLTFTHMDIEASAGCVYDSLTVLNNGKVLGKFCGSDNSADGHHPGNHPILSSGNRLTLIFQTDNNNPERHQNVGFSAHYQAIDIDECSAPEDASGPLCTQICLNTLGSYICSCRHGYELRSDQRSCVLSCGGGIFDEPEGFLFSPGYPNAPPYAVSCQYFISVEPGFTVSLNFSDNFHIESVDTQQGPSCLHHWLQVSIPDRDHIKLCGAKSPGLLVTNSNTVKLEYYTDDQGLSNGWSLDYTTQRMQCPFPGNVAKGRVTPMLTEYFYRDYIHVRCAQGYKLMMDGQELESFSTMCQSNGQWHLRLPECHIIDCGEPEPLLNGGVTFLSGFQNQYRSVIQYHCNEPFYSLLGGMNVSSTCESDRKWRSNHGDVVSPTCLPVCGRPTQHLSAYQRIIGGNIAPENTIPWQVLVSVNGGRGGGMVIADRWIMTAAHVVVQEGNSASNDTIRIYMGLTDVRTLTMSPVYAASVHIHPEYNNPRFIEYNNDIALIRLHDPITFRASVMPICLPAQDTYVTGMMGVVSGFGITEIDKRRILTNKLKYVHLPVVDQETCSKSVDLYKQGRSNVPNLTNNMFCAGVPEGGKDSCQGDSGSPYALSDNGQFRAAGIVSWGVDCGKQGTYGVYTKVANYVDWIEKTMQEN
nr:PREDICTED: uncharacterized protein LOC109633063 [Paralichthys olivaceus]